MKSPPLAFLILSIATLTNLAPKNYFVELTERNCFRVCVWSRILNLVREFIVSVRVFECGEMRDLSTDRHEAQSSKKKKSKKGL
jgi:hypothetical protein